MTAVIEQFVVRSQGNADGAYFGTTFPHLLLMTYPSLRPPQVTDPYVPRVFGFKLHPTALGREQQAAAAAAGPSNSGAAGTANAAGENSQQRDHTPQAAGAPSAAPASDRRGKRREDERHPLQGPATLTRTTLLQHDGRQDMETRAA